MLSLSILGAVLLVAWVALVWERDRRLAIARDWVHVPLLGGVLALVMALGLLLTS